MSKITIDEKEYETDDFTEQQSDILKELLYVKEEVRRLDYLTQVMDNRLKDLISSLNTALEESNRNA
tara:strand:- start:52 stop:252 length:201 start_codon:yes stop_codon:yes gene_type:complete